MTDVLIKRELLADLLSNDREKRIPAERTLYAILASPIQQGEAVEVVAWRSRLIDPPQNNPRWQLDYFQDNAPWVESEPLMTVAQHQRILAARVPAGCKAVPVDLIERTICRLTHGHEHDKAVRELRALLVSAEGVKDE